MNDPCPVCGAAASAGQLYAAMAVYATHGPLSSRDQVADALQADAAARHQYETTMMSGDDDGDGALPDS